MATNAETAQLFHVSPAFGQSLPPGMSASIDSNPPRYVFGRAPKDEPRTKESILYSIWPMAHFTSRTPLREHHSPVRENRSRGLRDNTNHVWNMSPLTDLPMSEGAQSPIQRDSTLPRRRKFSVPELGVGPMTTVQEVTMDSPTIPGRPAVHGPPGSSPRRLGLRRRAVAEDSSPLTPDTPKHADIVAEGSEKQWQARQIADKAERRASSMLLPNGLAPLLIPSNDSPCQPPKPLSAQGLDVMPPQVPPKSPRYLIRGSPHPTKTPVSASSSLSTLHTANSSVTSISTTEGRASPMRLQTPKRGENPLSNLRGASTPEERHSPTPWSAKEWRGGLSPTRHHRWGLSVDEINGFRPTETSMSGLASPGHQRGASETSVLNRGRPMKRGDTSLQRTMSNTINRNPERHMNVVLPEGFKTSDVSRVMTDQEMRLLKDDAEEQAISFEMLRHKDVLTLSKELRLLDERCEYLRKTHTSLREGRKNLHARMITYLKSPRTATFSVENMIKQEEALVELDDSIDDWMTKLELADERRAKIQRRLLEHVAATLTLKPGRCSQVQAAPDDQTPPRSPIKVDRSFSSERRDVESIRVYADSGVAALLAEIEREIDLME